jgi:uncharacterized protein YkwD
MVTNLIALCAGLALSAGPEETGAAKEAAQPAASQPAASQAAETAAVKKKVSAKPVSFAYFPVELEVVKATNAERARHGLPALELDPNLVTTARRHTWWMTRNRSMTHGNYPVAENIAMGQRSSGEVLNSWMNSSGHRANILNRGHRRIGVAAYTTSNGTVYWCQQFTQ